MKKFCLSFCIFSAWALICIIAIELFLPFNPQSFSREQLVKDEMLSAQNRKPSIVMLGGSSVVHGFNSEILSTATGYPVINDGLQAGIGMKLILDNCSRNLIPGDILVVAPEYSHFAGDAAYGGLYLADLVYLDIRTYLPMLNRQQVKTLVSNTPAHQMEKLVYNSYRLAGLKDSDEMYNLKAFNQFGDKISHYGQPNKPLGPPINQGGVFNDNFWDYFIEKLAKLQNNGISIIVFPAPTSASLYDYNEEWIEMLETKMKSNGFEYAIPTEKCRYDDSLFFDTHYHLNETGVDIHTRVLSDYINSLHI